MRTKRYVIILLSCFLVIATFPLTIFSKEGTKEETPKTNSSSASYSAKDEVIYGKLDANGNINNLYVVNSFYITDPGEIVDYGEYSSVRNLTDLSDINQIGKTQVHFQAEEDFYYQGALEKQPLPWDISITYLLDGKEMNPETLAGQSGDLEIQITTTANQEIDPVFFEYYLLQISLTLDPLIFHDIQAPKGTEANEGKNKLFAFNVMPGQEELIIVSARVSNMKMDPIAITAIPANIALENPDTDDITGDIKVLSDAIRDINSGVAELKNGVSELHSGATKLSSGSNAYQKGINELSQSSDGLVNGSKEILGALQQIDKALDNSPEMPSLDGLAELPKGFRDMAKELSSFTEVLTILQEAINDIPDSTIKDEQIKEVYDILIKSDADDSVVDVVKQLEMTYHAAQALKQINQTIPDDITQLIDTIAISLNETASGLEEAMKNLEQLDDLAELQTGLASLSSEYQAFHNGLVSYTEGVNALAKSYEELNTGTKQLASGTSELKDGVNKLHNGTTELEDSTSDLSGQIKTEIDKFMEEFDYSDFEPTSFVSSQNENVNVVQFVLQTESIEVEKPEIMPEKEKEKKSFWELFLDLFR